MKDKNLQNSIYSNKLTLIDSKGREYHLSLCDLNVYDDTGHKYMVGELFNSVLDNSSALLNIRSNEEALLSNLKTLSLEINEKLEALSAVNEALEEKLKLIEQKIKDKEVE